jgi:hypothetical protein
LFPSARRRIGWSRERRYPKVRLINGIPAPDCAFGVIRGQIMADENGWKRDDLKGSEKTPQPVKKIVFHRLYLLTIYIIRL